MITDKIKIIFVGSCRGKISTYFLGLMPFETQFAYYFQIETFARFKVWIKNNYSSLEKYIIIPVYCEDELKNRENYVSLAENIEAFLCKRKNIKIIHNSKLGKILGNKSLTNSFLSNVVRMPEINPKDGLVFVNQENGSGFNAFVSKNNINNYYCSRFIETDFIFEGEKYMVCPRTMCVGRKINEIYLRFRKYDGKHFSVHGSHTPMNANLHNSFFKERIEPNLSELNKICFDIGSVLGLGFYAHDFLIDKSSNFFLCETALKFDNSVWKGMNKSIINDLCFEKPFEQSVKDSIKLFDQEAREIIFD